MEQLTGSKWGKNDKAVYCHSAYLNYMQSISWEMLGWMNHKLELRLMEEISATSDTSFSSAYVARKCLPYHVVLRITRNNIHKDLAMFLGYALLKPSLKDFEYYLASI